ncbi:MAG: hypothetical protein R3F13_07170 [Prosthecobacter sp.]
MGAQVAGGEEGQEVEVQHLTLNVVSAVFTVPEQALRSLPDVIPGHPGIKISNCQSPRISAEDPTPSTFFFDQHRRKIVFQMLHAVPAQSSLPDRTFYGVLLERHRSWVPFAQRRFRSAIIAFLTRLGAIDTKQNLTEFLEFMKQRTQKTNQP